LATQNQEAAFATGNASGVSNIEYRIDDGVWTPYVQGIEISASSEVYFRQIDNVGNVGSIVQIKIFKDNVIPLQPVIVGAGTVVYTDEPYSVSFVAEDNLGGSGIAKVEYSIDKSSWTVIYPIGGVYTVTFAADGAYPLFLRLTDRANNIYPASLTDPEITVVITHAYPVISLAEFDADWVQEATKNAKFGFVLSDSNLEGFVGLRDFIIADYDLFGAYDAGDAVSIVGGEGIVNSLLPGTYYVYAYTELGTYNPEPFVLVVDKCDTVAPYIIEATAEVPWSNVDKPITVTLDLATTGREDDDTLCVYFVSTNSATPSVGAVGWDSEAKASSNGTYYVWAKDASGRISNAYPLTVVQIDKTPPVIGAASSSNYAVTFAASDAGGSLVAKYGFTTVNDYDASKMIPVPVPGASVSGLPAYGTNGQTIYLWAEDGAGNHNSSGKEVVVTGSGSSSNPATVTGFVIDNTPGAVNHRDFSATIGDLDTMLAYAVLTTTSVPARTSNDWKYVDDYGDAISGKTTALLRGSITANNAGSVNYYLFIMDIAGATTISGTSGYYAFVAGPIDSVAPVFTLDEALSGDTPETAVLTVTSTDIDLATTAYSFNGGATWGAVNTFTFTNERQRVSVWVRDAADNIAKQTYTSTLADTTSPTITAVVTDATVWTNAPKDVTFTFTDVNAVSYVIYQDVDHINVEVVSGDAERIADSNTHSAVEALGLGAYVIEASDVFGNTYSRPFSVLRVDDEPITFNVRVENRRIYTDTPGPEYPLDPYTSPISSGELLIVITSKGTSEGYLYSLNGGTTWQTSDTFIVNASGSYNIKVKNLVGTVSTAAPILIDFIDSTAPVVSAVSVLEGTELTYTDKHVSFTITESYASAYKSEYRTVSYIIEKTTPVKPESSDGRWTAAVLGVNTVELGAGTYYVWAKDKAGNVSLLLPPVEVVNIRKVLDFDNLEVYSPTSIYAHGSTSDLYIRDTVLGDVSEFGTLSLTGGIRLIEGVYLYPWTFIASDGSYESRSGMMEITSKSYAHVTYHYFTEYFAAVAGNLEYLYGDVNGGTLTLIEPVGDGHIFDGWYTDSDYKNKVTVITASGSASGEIELFMKYEIAEYAITYVDNGGYSSNRTTYTIFTSTFGINIPYRNGYTGLGYWDNPEFSGNRIEEIAKGSTGNMTLYAKYAVNGNEIYIYDEDVADILYLVYYGSGGSYFEIEGLNFGLQTNLSTATQQVFVNGLTDNKRIVVLKKEYITVDPDYLQIKLNISNVNVKPDSLSGWLDYESAPEVSGEDNSAITIRAGASVELRVNGVNKLEASKSGGAGILVPSADNASITITSGNLGSKSAEAHELTVIGKGNGAAIGGADSASGNITITAGEYGLLLDARAESFGAAGIGGSYGYAIGGDININGNVRVTATGGYYGAGIGGGYGGVFDSTFNTHYIHIGAAANVGTYYAIVIAEGGTQAAAIGGGYESDGDIHVTFDYSWVVANGAGEYDIGHGSNAESGAAAQIILKGGSVYAVGNSVQNAVDGNGGVPVAAVLVGEEIAGITLADGYATVFKIPDVTAGIQVNTNYRAPARSLSGFDVGFIGRAVERGIAAVLWLDKDTDTGTVSTHSIMFSSNKGVVRASINFHMLSTTRIWLNDIPSRPAEFYILPASTDGDELTLRWHGVQNEGFSLIDHYEFSIDDNPYWNVIPGGGNIRTVTIYAYNITNDLGGTDTENVQHNIPNIVSLRAVGTNGKKGEIATFEVLPINTVGTYSTPELQPAPPRYVLTEQGDGTVLIRFTTPENFGTYDPEADVIVYFISDDRQNWTRVLHDTSKLSHQILFVDLNNGTPYTFYVKTGGYAGGSDWESADADDAGYEVAVTATPGEVAGKPGTVRGLTGTAYGDDSIYLYWLPPMNDGGSPILYREIQYIEETDSGDAAANFANLNNVTNLNVGVAQSYMFTGLAESTRYIFRIRVWNYFEVPGEWVYHSLTTGAVELLKWPHAPAFDHEELTSSSVTVYWAPILTDAGSDNLPEGEVLSYELWINGSMQTLVRIMQGENFEYGLYSYTVDGLAAEQTITVSIRGVMPETYGDTTTREYTTNELTDAPSAPRYFTAKSLVPETGGVTLNWSIPLTGAVDGYRYLISETEDDATEFEFWVDYGATSVSEVGLELGMKYYVQLVAYNGYGNSGIVQISFTIPKKLTGITDGDLIVENIYYGTLLEEDTNPKFIANENVESYEYFYSANGENYYTIPETRLAAGGYTIKLVYCGKDGYAGGEIIKPFTVFPYVLTVEQFLDNMEGGELNSDGIHIDVTYDGDHAVISSSFDIFDDTIEFTILYKINNAFGTIVPISAGVYDLAVLFAGNANYTFATNTSFKLHILKRQVTPDYHFDIELTFDPYRIFNTYMSGIPFASDAYGVYYWFDTTGDLTFTPNCNQEYVVLYVLNPVMSANCEIASGESDRGAFTPVKYQLDLSSLITFSSSLPKAVKLSNGLPPIADYAIVPIPDANNKGTISWDLTLTPLSTAGTFYNWVWTPNQYDYYATINYAVAHGFIGNFTVTDKEVASVSALFVQNRVFFAGTSTATIQNYGTLTVTLLYNDGSSETTNDYSIAITTLDTAGVQSARVRYQGIPAEFNVFVTAIEVVGIEAAYTPDDGYIVYPNTQIAALKQRLTVWSVNNDGSTNLALDKEDFDVSGSLVPGNSVLSISYQGKYITSVTVPVVAITVTFNSNEGSIAPPVQTHSLGDFVTPVADPTRTYYRFDGWYNGNTLWNFATGNVTSDITLTAHWTRVYTVTVTNGSGAGSYVQGATVTIIPNAAPNGQRFKEWSVSGVTVTNLNNGTYSFTMPAANTAVTAVYEDIPAPVEIGIFTVNFTGFTGAYSVTVKDGEKVSRPSDPSLKGYTFIGWYAGSSAYNFNSVVTATLTLTAKFTVAEPNLALTIEERASGVRIITAFVVDKSPSITYNFQWYKETDGEWVEIDNEIEDVLVLTGEKIGGAYSCKVTAVDTASGATAEKAAGLSDSTLIIQDPGNGANTTFTIADILSKWYLWVALGVVLLGTVILVIVGIHEKRNN
jgi:uncharacterized repeat protein (TIGR02543 family)